MDGYNTLISDSLLAVPPSEPLHSNDDVVTVPNFTSPHEQSPQFVNYVPHKSFNYVK